MVRGGGGMVRLVKGQVDWEGRISWSWERGLVRVGVGGGHTLKRRHQMEGEDHKRWAFLSVSSKAFRTAVRLVWGV